MWIHLVALSFLMSAPSPVDVRLRTQELMSRDFSKSKSKTGKVLRQARVTFAASKSWKEKLESGGFELKQELICERTFLINVYDITTGEQPEFDFAPEDCVVSLDDKRGTTTYQAKLSLGAMFTEDTARRQKELTPVGVLNVGGKRTLMTTILTGASDDLQDMIINLPTNNQDFFKAQEVSIGMHISDR